MDNGGLNWGGECGGRVGLEIQGGTESMKDLSKIVIWKLASVT